MKKVMIKYYVLTVVIVAVLTLFVGTSLSFILMRTFDIGKVLAAIVSCIGAGIWFGLAGYYLYLTLPLEKIEKKVRRRRKLIIKDVLKEYCEKGYKAQYEKLVFSFCRDFYAEGVCDVNLEMYLLSTNYWEKLAPKMVLRIMDILDDDVYFYANNIYNFKAKLIESYDFSEITYEYANVAFDSNLVNYKKQFPELFKQCS